MRAYNLNRRDLERYGELKSAVARIEGEMREIRAKLQELNEYHVNIGAPITGMPNGNTTSDSTANFVIKLEEDRRRLMAKHNSLEKKLNSTKNQICKIRNAVFGVANKQLMQILKWHYLEGLTISQTADKVYLSRDGVYKKINRFFVKNK